MGVRDFSANLTIHIERKVDARVTDGYVNGIIKTANYDEREKGSPAILVKKRFA